MTPVERVRQVCLGLPEVTERLSHGEAAWFVRDKRQFVTMADHHHDDRLALWCAAAPGEQEALVTQDPERWFRPPYVGGRGWVGAYLDVDVDWAQLEQVLVDAYRQVAPKALVARLDEA